MAKKLNDKTKKVLNIIFTVFEVLVVVLLLLFSIITIQSSSTQKKTASLFGVTTFTVLTDSMNPTFEAGDMIVAKKVKEEQSKNLQIGDVICFWASIDVNGDGKKEAVVNTHRIYALKYAVEGQPDSGLFAYITKGDNNAEVDPYDVLPSEVIAKYSYSIPNVGGWIYGAKQGNRYFFIVVLPLIVLFIWNGYYVVKLVIENNKEKAFEQAKASQAMSEEEKQKLIEEAKRMALEELRKEQLNNQEKTDADAKENDASNNEGNETKE